MIGRERTPTGAPRGFFLTLEGIEGTGKSTHARYLAESLRELGYTVVVSREPGGTPLGEVLRGLLLGVDGECPVPRAELFLLLASRAQHVAGRILPDLNAGKIVICDRFGDASLAYQGGGRGLGVEAVAACNDLATGGLKPDRTLLLDITVDEAQRRVARRRRKEGSLDRLDMESEAFYRRVRDTYHRLAAAAPDRFRILETTREKKALAAEVLTLVRPWAAERRDAGGLV